MTCVVRAATASHHDEQPGHAAVALAAAASRRPRPGLEARGVARLAGAARLLGPMAADSGTPGRPLPRGRRDHCHGRCVGRSGVNRNGLDLAGLDPAALDTSETEMTDCRRGRRPEASDLEPQRRPSRGQVGSTPAEPSARPRGCRSTRSRRVRRAAGAPSAVGAYERGFRNLSLPRLREPRRVLRRADRRAARRGRAADEPPPSGRKIVLDLDALQRASTRAAAGAALPAVDHPRARATSTAGCSRCAATTCRRCAPCSARHPHRRGPAALGACCSRAWRCARGRSALRSRPNRFP